MIDFLKFVNSDTVRNHLRQIRYQPTALEAAWLAWQCETISLEGKCASWLEIIETLPDCPTYSRTMGLKAKYRDNTHTFLRAYIAQQKELTTAFYQTDESAVYHAEYQILPKGERFWREYRTIEEGFHTLESALKTIPKIEGDIIRITIYKKNSKGDFLTSARFLPDYRLAFVDAHPGYLNNDKWALHTGVLRYRGIPCIQNNFPSPFHPGDILYNPNMPKGLFSGGVFVAAEIEPHHYPSGFFLQNDKPDRILSLVPFLPDCEYYPVTSLTKPYRIFPLISKFLKRNHTALNPQAFADFINDHHDLLLSPITYN